jgi:hypothetical protein
LETRFLTASIHHGQPRCLNLLRRCLSVSPPKRK